MRSRFFSLVSRHNHQHVFGYGVEIIGCEVVRAVLYRRDPASRQAITQHYGSAASALAECGKTVPLDLIWDIDNETLPMTG